MEFKIFDVEKEEKSSGWEVWSGGTDIWMGKDYQDEIEDDQKLLDLGATAHYYANISKDGPSGQAYEKIEIKSINPYTEGLEFNETQNLLKSIKYVEECLDFPEWAEDAKMGWFLTVGDSLVLRKWQDRNQPYIVNMEDRKKVRELTGIDPDMMHGTDGEKVAMSEIDFPIMFG